MVEDIVEQLLVHNVREIPCRFVNSRVFRYKLGLVDKVKCRPSEKVDTRPEDIAAVAGEYVIDVPVLSRKQKPRHINYPSANLCEMSIPEVVEYDLDYEEVARRFLEQEYPVPATLVAKFTRGSPNYLTPHVLSPRYDPIREYMPLFFSDEIDLVDRELKLWERLKQVEVRVDFGYNPYDHARTKREAIANVFNGFSGFFRGFFSKKTIQTLYSAAQHDPEVREIVLDKIDDWWDFSVFRGSNEST